MFFKNNKPIIIVKGLSNESSEHKLENIDFIIFQVLKDKVDYFRLKKILTRYLRDSFPINEVNKFCDLIDLRLNYFTSNKRVFVERCS